MSESPAPCGPAEARLNHTALPRDAHALLDLLDERFRALYQNNKSRQPFLFDTIHIDLYNGDGPLRLTLRREETLTGYDNIPIYTNQLTGEVYPWSFEKENWNYACPTIRFTDAKTITDWLNQHLAP